MHLLAGNLKAVLWLGMLILIVFASPAKSAEVDEAMEKQERMNSAAEKSEFAYSAGYEAFASVVSGDKEATLNAYADAKWCNYPTLQEKLGARVRKLMSEALTKLGDQRLSDPEEFTEALNVMRALIMGFSVGRATGLGMVEYQWKGEGEFRAAFCHTVSQRAERAISAG